VFQVFIFFLHFHFKLYQSFFCGAVLKNIFICFFDEFRGTLAFAFGCLFVLLLAYVYIFYFLLSYANLLFKANKLVQ
jgi:hypothetical protein